MKRTFVNELDHVINMEADWVSAEALQISAIGPSSWLEHVWTRAEAKALRDLLDEALAAPTGGQQP